MEEKRFCKKCLLADFGESDLLRSIQEYIDLLTPEQKASKAVVEQRLTICRSCGKLQNGMCSICGCFVEARTATAQQTCPDAPSRWGREDKTE